MSGFPFVVVGIGLTLAGILLIILLWWHVFSRKVTRRVAVTNADIQHAIVCCQAVYQTDSNGETDKVIKHFNENKPLHNFDRVCVSKYGRVRYLLAVQEGDTARDSKGDNKQSEVFIAFRGTNNFDDVLSDLKLFPKASDYEGRLHAGFYEIAEMIPVETILQKYRGYRIVICGHSMGGAVAQIVALEMLVQMDIKQIKDTTTCCISFGAPLVATKGVTEFVDKHEMASKFVNVINQGDPVPRLLMLSQSLQQVASSSSQFAEQANGVITPILDVLSHAPHAIVSSSASVARDVLLGIVDGTKNFESFLQENGSELKDLDKIYSPLGEFLFLEQEESKRKWLNNCISNQEKITERLLKKTDISERSISQHTIKNYLLTWTRLVSQAEQIGTGTKDSHRDQDVYSVEQSNEFPLELSSVDFKKCSGDRLDVSIGGKNLSFISLKDSKFKGISVRKVDLISKDNESVKLTLHLDSESIIKPLLTIEIATHFEKGCFEKDSKDLQERGANTLKTILEDDLNPMMLQQAFERGVAQVTMARSSREESIRENVLLKTLFKLEQTTNPKLQKIEGGVLWRTALDSTKDGTLAFTNEHSKKTLDTFKRIVQQTLSKLIIQTERRGFLREATIGTILSAAGALAKNQMSQLSLSLTGLGTLLVQTATAVTMPQLALASAGLFAVVSSVGVVYYYYTSGNEDGSYRDILCFLCTMMSRMDTGNFQSESTLQLEKRLHDICQDPNYDNRINYLCLRGNEGRTEQLTKKSKKDISDRINMCLSVHKIRQVLSRACCVCVVGTQDAGKSTTIKEVWGVDVENIGLSVHTTKATLYSITPHCTVIDFPGSDSLDESIAGTMQYLGATASFFIYITKFQGDPTKLHREELKKVIPFGCPVLICLSQCSRYKNELSTKKAISHFKTAYSDVFNAIDVPEFEVMFTELIELTTEMKNVGIKGVEDVQKWMKNWLVKNSVYREDDAQLQSAVGRKAGSTGQ
ncbi:unnamed protein product [Owenia fusiformis]|uniref:Fungal lipase-type domain-containing protein n=1 Tax=Owenia fusiformis TaxID=6347 RepID=A0A8J1UVL6_OWEFU|nr:unnamed protein product [Owenia fusiformis]